MERTPKELSPLLDADFLKYNVGFSADSQVRKELKEANPDANAEEIESLLKDPSNDYLYIALGNVKKALETWMAPFNPEHRIYVHLGGNYREQMATIKPYKGNRDPSHKPKYAKDIVEYLLAKWDALGVEGIETDDAIAIDQYSHVDRSTVIVSIDKDLLHGVPGWSYNPVKDVLKYTTLDEANKFLFWQMLVGDTADNIGGIKGIGPKRATAMLEACNGDIVLYKKAVEQQYQKQFGDNWVEAYTETSRLLYILRDLSHKDKGHPWLCQPELY